MKFEKNKWVNTIVSSKNSSLYIGRFAPSPTGPLHLGSLYTALASFLDAKAHRGLWKLRIDDIDFLRVVPSSIDTILRTLDIFGLHWDGDVVYQSQQVELYHSVLNELIANDLIYRCNCTRKMSKGDEYSGKCRFQFVLPTEPHALRLKINQIHIHWEDRVQGQMAFSLQEGLDDFIVKRKDGIIAYQFAVVIDDWFQQINQIVRGVDLLDSTPKQLYLQHLLNLKTPCYAHLPVIVNNQGIKLSKQTFAEPVDISKPQQTLFYVLTLLKQNPPLYLQNTTVNEILNWAIIHWNINLLQTIKQIIV